MLENNFMVENCASLPMEALLNIASYMNGNEGWQRLKQCKALRVLQRKWKPSIFEREGEGESRYYVLISNICLKGDKALSYALKPPKELLRVMKYDEEIKVGIEISSKIMYRNNICNCSYYASSEQNKITSRASLQFYIEKIVEEIKQTMKRDEIITIEHITFEIFT